jgi:gibberellin 2-oxidase
MMIVHDSSIVSAYTEAVKGLACEILELMAEGLGVPNKSIFSTFITQLDNDSLLRFNHYPPKDCKDRDNSNSYNVGFGEHSDPQILTILRSNDVAGLQISLQHGVWNPVTPDPFAFCVNVGDLLEVYYMFLSISNFTQSPKSRIHAVNIIVNAYDKPNF